MKGICENCGVYDELYLYETINEKGYMEPIEICRDCLEELTEQENE